jgi:Flp pilus assembly protein TadD
VDGAISQFRSAIKIAPDYAPAHQELAHALTQKGQQAEADEEYRKAAQLSGTHPAQ